MQKASGRSCNLGWMHPLLEIWDQRRQRVGKTSLDLQSLTTAYRWLYPTRSKPEREAPGMQSAEVSLSGPREGQKVNLRREQRINSTATNWLCDTVHINGKAARVQSQIYLRTFQQMHGLKYNINEREDLRRQGGPAFRNPKGYNSLLELILWEMGSKDKFLLQSQQGACLCAVLEQLLVQ